MATIEKPRVKEELVSGADILVQSLVNHGVETIFAYPGGCSMPLHQALTRFGDKLRTILPRHEQGGAFAAQGVARSTPGGMKVRTPNAIMGVRGTTFAVQVTEGAP